MEKSLTKFYAVRLVWTNGSNAHKEKGDRKAQFGKNKLPFSVP